MLKTEKSVDQWIVYKLVNRTQREIYFGISRRPMHSLQDHKKAGIPSTDYWDFMRDDIEHHVIYTQLSKDTAVAKAKELGKSPNMAGFEVINTFEVQH